MANRHTRSISFLMTLVMLLSILGSTCACSKNSSKKNEKLKKDAQGIVENYLVYLSSGRTEKLSRYTDSENDPFQNQEFSMSQEEVLWDALIKQLTFEFGDTEIDDDEATVAVTIGLPDGKKIAGKSKDSPFTYTSATTLVSESEKYIYADIEIPVSLEDDKAVISSTEELYEQGLEQFSTICDAIPEGDEDMKSKVEEFMQALHDMNIPYLYQHSSIPHLDDYDPVAEGITEACNSFLTYEIEYVVLNNQNSADFIVHAHCKNSEKAAQNFFSDPVNLAPAFCDAFDAMAGGTVDFEKEYYEYININDLVPGFIDELENTPDIDVDIPVTITVDGKDPSSYTIEGIFTEIMPPFDPLDYSDEIDEEGEILCYQTSIELLYANGRIDDNEYAMCRRALGVYSFDEAAFRDVMAKYGFTQDTTQPLDNLYENGQFFQVNLDNRDRIIDSALENGDVLRDTQAMIEEGVASGEVSGGWFDFEFIGSSTEDYIFIEGDDGAEHTVYLRSLVINEYILAFMILDYTDEDIEMTKTIIHDLGLE